MSKEKAQGISAVYIEQPVWQWKPIRRCDTDINVRKSKGVS